MEIKIKFEAPEWSKGNKRKVVIVEFPNTLSTKSNKTFKWIPTWKQIADIIEIMMKAENESWKDHFQNMKDESRTE